MIIIKRHELQKKALAAAIFAKGGRHFLGATGPSVSAGGRGSQMWDVLVLLRGY